MAGWKIDDFPLRWACVGDFPLPCLIAGGQRHDMMSSYPEAESWPSAALFSAPLQEADDEEMQWQKAMFS